VLEALRHASASNHQAVTSMAADKK
jgi:hypothetical protein